MPGQVQLSNDEQTTLLSSRFPQRDEPNYAWGNVCSFYNALTALRAFWPCGPQIATTQSLLITDTADNFHLSAINAPVWGYESLIPYIEFNGANQYGFYADNAQFDILGNEAYNAQPGLTMGCWIYPDRVTGTREYLLSKWDEAIPLSSAYRIMRGVGGNTSFAISTGAASPGVSSTSLVRQSIWQFVAGRFVSGATLDVYLSTDIGTLEKTSAATAVAAMQNSAYNFTMASDGTPSLYFDGKISLAFICASALSDTIINELYQLSRPLFGQ